MVTALSSLYLLTVLGVEGEPNDLVAVVGACAGSCSGLAALTCCYSIFRRYEKYIDVVVIHNDLLPKKQADGQIISHGESWKCMKSFEILDPDDNGHEWGDIEYNRSSWAKGQVRASSCW